MMKMKVWKKLYLYLYLYLYDSVAEEKGRLGWSLGVEVDWAGLGWAGLGGSV